MTSDLLTRRLAGGAATSVLAPAAKEGIPEGTFEAVVATPFRVRRSGVRPDGTIGLWDEILDIAGLDTSRAEGGPLLLDHKRESREQVGVIEAVRVVPGVGVIAEFRFTSGPLGRAYAKDVAERTRRQLSAGYAVEQWERTGGTRAVPEFTARRWILHEASLVVLGADPGARVIPSAVRTLTDGAQQMFFNFGNRAQEAASAILTRDDGAAAVPAAGDDGRVGRDYALAVARIASQRGLEDQLPRLMAREHTEQEVNDLSRTVQHVTRTAKGMGVDPSAGRRVLAEGGDINDAVAALNESYRNKPPSLAVRNTHLGLPGTTASAEPELSLRDLGEIVAAHKMNPAVPLPASAEARDLARMSLMDIAATVQRQEADGNLAPRGGFGARMGSMFGRSGAASGGYNTTTDFPTLMANAGNRALAQRFERVAPPLLAVARRTEVADFRDIQRIHTGRPGPLRGMLEAGEYNRVTTAVSAETYRVATYGDIFPVSRQLLVNDDLGALQAFINRSAEASAETLGDLLWLAIRGPADRGLAMADGVYAFHASRGNVAAVGTMLDVANLSAGRAAMRKFASTGANGRRAGIAPAILVVGPDQETQAESLLANLNATEVGSVNPFAGRLQLVVEHRIEDNRFYLFPTPAAATVLEYAELSGQRPFSGPDIRTAVREGFDVDGFEYKVSYDVGAGLVSTYAYLNPGAA